MATEKLVQNSFVNGQYDREVQSKERSDFIGQGLAKALNVVSSEKGELRKRLGTKHLLNLSSATVLIPFRMNNEDDAIITIDASGSNNVKGYTYSDGELKQLLTSTNESVVAFPVGNTWSNGQAGDTSITNGDWTVEASFFGSYNPGSLFNNINAGYGPFGCGGYPGVIHAPSYIMITNSNTDLCMRDIKIWFWSAKTEGYGYSFLSDPVIQYSDDGITWTGVQTNYDVGQYTQVRYEHSGHGIPDRYISKCYMTITQTNYGDNHPYWRVYFMSEYSGGGILVDSASFVDVSAPTVFEQTVAYSENDLKKIKYAQDSNEMFIACEGVIPQRLVNNTGVLTFGGFTPTNTAALWSTIGGYPTCVALFQNRLWFGGFENNPQTVIASKFDDYETFNVSSPVQYDDYLNLRCNQLKTKITNIIGGQKVLYAFSEDGLSFVDSGNGGMIATNQSIEFNLRNRMPAGGSTPAFKDDVMLYGSSDGTKLYAVDYDLITERFQVDDLAKYAKDITFDKITELHYVNDESKMIYGLLESGTMFALNYKKGVYQGFFPFEIQDGYVYDIVQIKVGRNYKLLLVTCRSGSWYIEEMPDKGNYINTNAPFMKKEDKKWATYDNINNNPALDCYQKYEDSIEITATLDYDNLTLTTTTDLSAYIGSQVMLGQVNNDSQWVILTIDSTDLTNVYNVTIDSYRGNSTVFDTLFRSTTQLPVAVPAGTDIGVVSQGQYLGNFKANDVGVLSSLYGWQNGADVIYTNGSAPMVGDQLYDNTGAEITSYYQNTVAAYDSGNDEITVNASIQQSTTQDLYCWGDVYTLSATPSVGDQLYNADGTPTTDYLYNTVHSVSGSTITTVETETPYSATYAWTDANNNTIYTYTTSLTHGQTVQLSNGYYATVAGGLYILSSFVNGGITYNRTNTVENNRRYYSGGAGCWIPLEYSDDVPTTPYPCVAYANSTGTESGPRPWSPAKTYTTEPIYLKYNNVSYNRNSAADVPAGSTITTVSFTRDSTGDIESQTISTIVTKVFSRASSYDLITDSVIITLPKPVFKATYGALYESYAFIKVTRPYESMKTVRQINLEVQNTMHLSVGTALSDRQVLEDINDNTHYDLTNMTMNGGYVVVPGDTPEWEKYIILKSDKGLPFTVDAVEVIMNYSNEGGN